MKRIFKFESDIALNYFADGLEYSSIKHEVTMLDEFDYMMEISYEPTTDNEAIIDDLLNTVADF